MNMHKLMACLLAASPVLALPIAQAQPAPAATAAPQAGASLTLAQAYQAALEQDATLRAARAATDSRRERLPQARAQLLPNVSVTASRNKNDLNSRTPGVAGRPNETERDYMSGSRGLTVRQPLYRPAQWADVRQAEAQVADANAQLEKEVQNLAVRLASAYLEAVLARDQPAVSNPENDGGRIVAVTRQSDRIGVASAHDLDRLRPLELIEPFECIAKLGCAFIVLSVARLLHTLAQPRANLQRLAG